MDIQLRCIIKEGLMPRERLAEIVTADGPIEAVLVPLEQISNDTLTVSELGRHGSRVLVELPRETVSGRWSVWVHEDAIAA